MEIQEFRSKAMPDIAIVVDDRELIIKQVIKFRFDDGGFYIKCFLSEDYVLADDEESNCFLLVKPVKTDFKSPFPKELNYNGKNFTFLYDAHAFAEEVWGDEIFKKGESESFWDYKSEDGSYLSLGIDDKTQKRMDFLGKIVESSKVRLS